MPCKVVGKKRTQTFILNTIPLRNSKDCIIKKFKKLLFAELDSIFSPSTDIHKISIPYTSARISMSVLKVQYEPTYKERRGCFLLNTNVIRCITDYFHSFLKAMKTPLHTTLGPQLLAQVTSFRVSACAGGCAAIIQTWSTKLHAQERLSNQKCEDFNGTLQTERCQYLSWSWVRVWG